MSERKELLYRTSEAAECGKHGTMHGTELWSTDYTQKYKGLNPSSSNVTED